ncbi:MAG: hypothetical protein GC155_11225 [Alphaproteobacteria bacterium]|nr:hypothetical protein [Alphaproteobacteria bacterium]
MRTDLGAAGLFAGCLCVTPLAAGQTPGLAPQPVTSEAYTAPRTSSGQPDLEGIWTQNFLILMEASPNAPLTLPEPAAKAMAAAVAKGVSSGFDKQLDPEVPALMQVTDGLPIVRGERRTRSVVEPADGRLPYTDAARKESSRGYGSNQADNPEERPNWERCVTSLGLPPISGMYTTSANPRQIIQTRDAIVLHTEYGDEARIIPLTSTHKPAELTSSLGDSIAHWEGDTLVIETVRLPAKDRVRAFSNLIVPTTGKVIERYTRLSENELLYQYTVIDPSTYTAPWLAEYSLYRTDQRMFEHACHEGNYSLPNILKAQRIEDARKAAGKPKSPGAN